MNEKNYSIIIPFYNEENNLIELHYELLEQLKKISSDKRKFQLIYVDDGSNDNTLLNIKSLDFNNFEYMIIENIINLSQSISLKNAIKESAYENIIILDGDLQNDPKDIPQMINIYENEKKSIDVVCGWRKFRKDNFFTRILPSLVANFLIRLLFKSKIHDHGCALKIIKKNVFNESNMWGDFHRLFLARIAHYKLNITEVQVNHRVRKDGKSNYGCGRIANVLIDLFYLKFVNLNKKNSIYFFGKISILLLFFSFLSTLYMFFIKYKFNISFILTPLPILSIFLFTIAILFFFIGIIVQNQITYGHNSGDYKLFFRIHKKNNN